MTRKYDHIRANAIVALNQILNQDKFSNDVINDIFSKNNFPDLDKRFMVALIYGTLEQLPILDYWINELSHIEFQKIDDFVLLILRMSFWQIEFSEKIPPSAAINEAVKLTKYFHKNQYSGYVNAILRESLRNPIKLPKKREHLKYGLSAEMFGLYKKWFGETKAKHILENSSPKDLTVLLLDNNYNEWLKSLEEKGIKYKPGHLIQDAYQIVDFSENVSKLPGFAEGEIYIQDESSMLPSKTIHLFKNRENQSIKMLDACAGLGGKSISFINEDPTLDITALEPNQKRFNGLNENIKRLNLKQIEAKNIDLQTFSLQNKDGNKFDFILLDVPCSGLGIIRHKPEIKIKMNYQKIQEFPKLQFELLQEAAKLVNENGILCYSTCTINPDENQNLIQKFLETKSGKQFMKLNMEKLLPYIKEEGRPILKEYIFDSDIQIYPSHYNLDGFYISCLKKR